MTTSVSNFRANIKTALSRLNSPVRIVLLALGVLAGAAILFWLFNQMFYYVVAKSYVDELSGAYSINKGFTKALVWASFGAVVFFAGMVFSFSKRKRTVGYLGILGLLIGHGVLLGMRDTLYDPNTGRTEKCYVIARDGIKILNHVGVDPDTGRECRTATPQMTEKYNAYRDGHRPQLITDRDPAFFDPVSGEPIVWYAKTAGRIELFDLMGFHPKTGEELKPIDRQIVDEWRAQSSTVVRRVPNRIDPDKFGFFDQLSGKAKVWFWVSDAGDYEFYDGPGFHPKSGDALKPVSRDVITKWKQAVQAAHDKTRIADQQANGEAQRQQPPSFAEAWKQCQSSDADQRVIGCGFVISQGGGGSKGKLADALDGRCWAYHAKGLYDLAVTDCRASIALRPTYSFAYNNLASAYLGLKKFDEARIAASKSVELKPSFFWSNLNLARAYVGLGQNERALAAYQVALSLDPNSAEAKEEYRDVMASVNNLRNLGAVASPSFDCSKASYADEHAICDNTELSQLDRVVVAAYESVRRLHGDQYAKTIAAPLLQSRHACNSDVSCIKNLQLASIKKFQASGAQLNEVKCRVMDPTNTPLNVRAAPQGNVIGNLKNEELVYVMNQSSDPSGRLWAEISENPSGKAIGWVFREFIACF